MKALLLALLLLAPTLHAGEKSAPVELAEAAAAFIDSLDEATAARARFALGDEERLDWHYTPARRKGLPLKAMTESQKDAAVALVNAILSDEGALKARQIISLEAVLGAIESQPEFRDPEKYFVSIFSEPGDPAGWGMRFEGHHLSINVTVVGESISVTPSFMGANPAEVREGPEKGLRPLAAEEDLARILATALVESGKTAVVFDDRPPGEILTREKRVANPLKAVGLSAAEMTEAQRKALVELITEYTGRHRPEVAQADIAEIREVGIGKIYFGWAGSLEPGRAFYYRVQGPTFLLECANTQNDANHIHTVWRDFDGDFGRDLLREHLETHSHD